jgi:hypothetical protein
LVWGLTAKQVGIPAALVYAGLGIAVQLALLSRYRINGKSNIKLSPLGYPLPETSREVNPEEGPVMVTVEHRINRSDVNDFENVMREIRRIRLRDGATQWWLFQDTTQPGRYVETFIVKSWAEHMRQHERTTVADFEIEQRARSYHNDDTPLITSHLIDAYSYSNTKTEISLTNNKTQEDSSSQSNFLISGNTKDSRNNLFHRLSVSYVLASMKGCANDYRGNLCLTEMELFHSF